ncbi:ABC transporter permease [Allostreptomyces psammosilenae]|uniref:ABC transporter permease n=1 Tax=Allostreptomyces psammosilenae TaxID=1892865 RepID=UPI0015C9F14A|nr:ABC transporter permease [Allostreptomyces psammosilenae]
MPAVALLAVPLLLALFGPLFAGPPGPRGVAFQPPGDGHWLGTDFTGRDVWREVLLGGRTVVLVAACAVGVAYAAALPVGLAAALTGRRRVEDALLRPLDVLMAIPSLLVLLLVSARLTPGPAALVFLVALVNVPDVARVVRGAAAEIAARPVVEAMRLQGESRWRIAVGYVARSMLRTVAADAGTRLTGALYLVATASFLGVGVAPDASDWAVMVDRNRTGMLIQPWGVVVPALLVTALTVGVNLFFDAALHRRAGRAAAGTRATGSAARRGRPDRKGRGEAGTP